MAAGVSKCIYGALCCANIAPAATCPPVEASPNPDGGWHTNACHPVQHVASNLCFDLLTGQSPGEESPPNDGFVPIHRSLNEASSVVARTTLPADATMLFDGGNMLIALRRPTRTRDRCGPRWNDDVSLRMSIRHSVVDSLTIICAVGYHRRDPHCDLIKKTHYFRYVADIVLRQFNGDDFMRFGIDAEMQFAPTPRGTNTTLLIQPLALAIDLQTSTVDEEMEWFVTTNRPLAEWSTRPLGGSMSCGRESQYRCRAEPRSIAAVLQSDAVAGGTPGEA